MNCQTILPARLCRSNRAGVAWLEVFVVLFIVFVLLAISIPFIQSMRELTRRSNCDQNLIRLALAVQAYSNEHTHLPTGSSTFNATFLLWPGDSFPETGEETDASEPDVYPRLIASVPVGYHHNWATSLLPYVDQAGLFQSVDYASSAYGPSNRLVRETMLPVLRCPTDDSVPSASSYAGIHHDQEASIAENNDGLLLLNGWVLPDQVTDGLSATILFGEKLSPPDDLGWISGTRATLRNAGQPINADTLLERLEDPMYVGGLASRHVGGASVVKGDGAVMFLSDTIDMQLYQAMANRRDQADRQP